MSEISQILLISTVYRIVILIIGLVFVYFGFKIIYRIIPNKIENWFRLNDIERITPFRIRIVIKWLIMVVIGIAFVIIGICVILIPIKGDIKNDTKTIIELQTLIRNNQKIQLCENLLNKNLDYEIGKIINKLENKKTLNDKEIKEINILIHRIHRLTKQYICYCSKKNK